MKKNGIHGGRKFCNTCYFTEGRCVELGVLWKERKWKYIRAATSVATRISREPALNLLSAPRRADCDSWPCRGIAPNPSVRRRIANRWVSLTVLVKIMVEWPAKLLTR